MWRAIRAAATLGALVLLPAGNAFAQVCLTTVSGSSGADAMVLCERYPTGSNRVYVAVCDAEGLTWYDVCDEYGVLTNDLVINGMGGNDLIRTWDFSGTFYNGQCSFTCWGEVDLDVYTVDLYGGDGHDSLSSDNDTGLVRFYGGDGHDEMWHLGSYSGNYYEGGQGNDSIIDGGGLGDVLYGDGGDDCLEDYSGLGTMDCGDDTDEYAWGGCPDPREPCQGPVNCETPTSSCPFGP